MTPTTLPPPYYSVSQLRGRGWTQRLIDHFLGAPDDSQLNVMAPVNRRGRPMRLFSVDRVQLVESDPGFNEKAGESKLRGLIAVEGVRIKSEAILSIVAHVRMPLADWSVDELVVATAEQFGFSDSEDVEFKNQLHILLRQAAACEVVLDDYFGHTGIRQCRIALRKKMLEAITTKFPHLSNVAQAWLKQERGNAEISLGLE